MRGILSPPAASTELGMATATAPSARKKSRRFISITSSARASRLFMTGTPGIDVESNHRF
jgi:hypothetical protein